MTTEHDDAVLPPRALALSDDLRLALKGLIRALQRDGAGMDSGVSLMQYMLLSLIHDQPGIGVAALARLQNVRGPTVSGQIKALEQAGLVERSAPDPEDRRRAGLQLSEQGQRTLGAFRAMRRDEMARRVARLSPQQMDVLAAAMTPLLELGRP